MSVSVNVYEDNLRRLIREHIKAERVSLSKVADQIGVSYPTLNGFMTGNATARDATVEKIETFFERIQPNGEAMQTTITRPNGVHPFPARSGLPEGFGFMDMTPPAARYVRVNKSGLNIAKQFRVDAKAEHVRIAVNEQTAELLILPASASDPHVLKLGGNGTLTSLRLRAWMVEHGAETGTRYPAQFEHGGWLIRLKGQAA